MVELITHIDQIINILESNLTGYEHEEGGTAESFTISRLPPPNSNVLTDEELLSITIKAESKTALETILATIKKLDYRNANGYSHGNIVTLATDAFDAYTDSPADGDFKYPSAKCVDLTPASWTVAEWADPWVTRELVTFNGHTNYLHLVSNAGSGNVCYQSITTTLLNETDYWISSYIIPHIAGAGFIYLTFGDDDNRIIFQSGNITMGNTTVVYTYTNDLEYRIIYHVTGGKIEEIYVFESDILVATANPEDPTPHSSNDVGMFVGSTGGTSTYLYIDPLMITTSKAEAFGDYVANMKSFSIVDDVYYLIPTVNLKDKIVLTLPEINPLSISWTLYFTTLAASTATVTISYSEDEILYYDDDVTLSASTDSATLSGTSQSISLSNLSGHYMLISFSVPTNISRTGFELISYFHPDSTYPYHLEVSITEKYVTEAVVNILARWDNS
jgi:hypothetical protein